MKTTFRLPSVNFWQRSLFSSAFIVATSTLIALSHLPLCEWFFVAGLATIQYVALVEYVRLCRSKDFDPAATLLYWFSLFYILVYSLATLFPKFSHLPMFFLFLGALSTPLAFLNRQRGACANLALTVFGFVYITFPLSWLVDINFMPRLPSGDTTTFWITWLLVTTKGSDMAAYFAGKLFGRHPLALSLSPKKTIEGAVGGLVGAAALSAALHRFWLYPSPTLSLSTWLLLGGIVGIAAMIGDLSESLLKRDAGVKDSNTIPGLGGVLDIIDSILFSAPLLYVYLKVVGLLGS
jgi:phosphatidate cytidylyltransferase